MVDPERAIDDYHPHFGRRGGPGRSATEPRDSYRFEALSIRIGSSGTGILDGNIE